MFASVGLGLAILVPHAALLSGAVAPVWDAIDFFAPYYMLVGDFARNGQFLLWNPFTFAGSPDYLEPQLGSFSPPLLAAGLIFGGTPLAFELYWFAIWLLGGLGVLALARHFGAPAWGGFVCAIGLVFSGFYTGNAQNTAMLYSASFLPLLLWRVDVALASHGWRPAFEGGALFGLSGLGGYPALVLLNGCFALLWSLGRLFMLADTAHRTVLHRFKRVVAVHMMVAVTGAAIMSPTYIPFFIEGPDVSDRAGPLARDDAVENDALDPAAVVTLSSPALALAGVFEYTDISMRSLYVGCLVLALAAFALVSRRQVAFRWWLLFVALVFLASAMGQALPVRGWLYEWFPPTRYFRHPALFRWYVIFALTVLGLYGARDLAAARRTRDSHGLRKFGWIVLALAATMIAVYVGAVVYIREATPPPHVSSHWHTFASWFYLCAVSAAVWLSDRARVSRFLPAALVVLAAGDALSTARLVRPTMYDVHGARWRALETLHRSQIDLTGNGLMRLLENGGNHTFVSKIPALRGYSGLAGRLLRRTADDALLAESATGIDRLWFSPSAAVVERSEKCFDVFRARAVALGRIPLVIHHEVAASGSKPLHGGTTTDTCDSVVRSLPAARRASSYKVWDHRPSRLLIRVDVPESGWLLVTDTWSRGWRATVNGSLTPIVRANFVFRAVSVSGGTNFVDFRYEPIGFPWLLVCSWGLLLIVSTWTAASWRLARGSTRSSGARG
jgi:hypothetical protein